MTPLLPAHIDSTMMTAFRSCPRKFYHTHILGLRRAGTSIDLIAGGAFAKGLETFYREVHENSSPTAKAMSTAFTAFSESWGDTPKEPLSDSPKSFDRMFEALADYVSTYPPLTDHVQPYRDAKGKATYEFSFGIPLDFPGFPLHPSGDPFIYCGRFDMLGVYQNRPCVRDEKTSKYAGATWADQWNLRNQFMGYVWACQHFGIDLETVVVRGVIIQKKEIKQLEAIKIFPHHMIDRWFDQLRHDVTRLRKAWDENHFDYNFGDTCTSYGSCEFTDFCSDKNPWYEDPKFTVRRWNPLTHEETGESK
jgi:hypothetical protein